MTLMIAAAENDPRDWGECYGVKHTQELHKEFDKWAVPRHRHGYHLTLLGRMIMLAKEAGKDISCEDGPK